MLLKLLLFETQHLKQWVLPLWRQRPAWETSLGSSSSSSLLCGSCLKYEGGLNIWSVSRAFFFYYQGSIFKEASSCTRTYPRSSHGQNQSRRSTGRYWWRAGWATSRRRTPARWTGCGWCSAARWGRCRNAGVCRSTKSKQVWEIY